MVVFISLLSRKELQMRPKQKHSVALGRPRPFRLHFILTLDTLSLPFTSPSQNLNSDNCNILLLPLSLPPNQSGFSALCSSILFYSSFSALINSLSNASTTGVEKRYMHCSSVLPPSVNLSSKDSAAHSYVNVRIVAVTFCRIKSPFFQAQPTRSVKYLSNRMHASVKM